jgi:uroporphyrinogen-III synthase
MAKPLHSKRIIVTRSPDLADSMCQQLAALGAIPIRFPTIDFMPLPAPELAAALMNLASYEWLVFTSGNGVRFFFERVSSIKYHVSSGEWPRVAAVGEATARQLVARGVAADFIPEAFTGEQLVLGLGDIAGQKVLLPRAKIGRPEIVELLREHGAMVDEIALYESVAAVPTPAALAEVAKGVDVITFTSPSTVRNFLEIVRPEGFTKAGRSALIACIGPTTAAEAEQQGLMVAIRPKIHTIDSLITALVAHFEKENC